MISYDGLFYLLEKNGLKKSLSFGLSHVGEAIAFVLGKWCLKNTKTRHAWL